MTYRACNANQLKTNENPHPRTSSRTRETTLERCDRTPALRALSRCGPGSTPTTAPRGGCSRSPLCSGARAGRYASSVAAAVDTGHYKLESYAHHARLSGGSDRRRSPLRHPRQTEANTRSVANSTELARACQPSTHLKHSICCVLMVTEAQPAQPRAFVGLPAPSYRQTVPRRPHFSHTLT